MLTQEELIETIRRSLKIVRLDAADKMGSVRGWDSLKHVHLLLELEKTYQCEIPADQFGALTSVDSIISHFRSNGQLMN
jgi:acyl carrier protein